MQRVALLKDHVMHAFANVPSPGDDNLVSDATGYDPESAEIAAALRGRNWRTISAGEVRRYADALPLLTPAAFRYFLPSYILHCAESWRELDVAPSSLVFNLTPPATKSGLAWEHFRERARLFEDEERACIIEYLELAEAIERADWVSAGKQPPIDRVGPSLRWWRQYAGDRC